MAIDASLYITTEAELNAWVDSLRTTTILAVDTESDSLHRYREKTCLLQMTAHGQDAILDPLALPSLAPLAPILADPARTKIFHDACYDLICLQRDFGLQVRGIFDTMLASRLLGRRQFGLASLLQEHFNFTADKRLQRSDWARRPLTAEQVNYARFDTHFLPGLMERLAADLAAQGRLAWAEEDFARLPATCERLSAGRDVGPDEDGFWRIAGARALDAEGRGRLRALYLARDHIARRLDRPPFKVLGDGVLLDLACHPPTPLAGLTPRPGLRRAGLDRFGAELWAALKTATPVPGSAPAGPRRRRAGRFLDPDARDRYEALRQARRRVADGLGLEPEAALGNAALEEFARRPPQSEAQLAARPELAGWRGPHLIAPLFAALVAPSSAPAGLPRES